MVWIRDDGNAGTKLGTFNVSTDDSSDFEEDKDDNEASEFTIDDSVLEKGSKTDEKLRNALFVRTRRKRRRASWTNPVQRPSSTACTAVL